MWVVPRSAQAAVFLTITIAGVVKIISIMIIVRSFQQRIKRNYDGGGLAAHHLVLVHSWVKYWRIHGIYTLHKDDGRVLRCWIIVHVLYFDSVVAAVGCGFFFCFIFCPDKRFPLRGYSVVKMDLSVNFSFSWR
jgi:hypothetical protein